MKISRKKKKKKKKMNRKDDKRTSKKGGIQASKLFEIITKIVFFFLSVVKLSKSILLRLREIKMNKRRRKENRKEERN